ncbi:hypothetical protein BH24BAC1_BH24BAC1_27480 [soil metagenome]
MRELMLILLSVIRGSIPVRRSVVNKSRYHLNLD